MKKNTPLLLLVVGVLVFIGIFMFMRGRSNGNLVEEEEFVPELAVSDRPFTSLTPSEDGHWLKLLVDGIDVPGAESMDYELLYKVEDGRTQGVPGIISLDGSSSIERDLLLGSESSGIFRYDVGVNSGSLTLKFRNGSGKLIGKVSTDFALLSDTKELSSVDEAFVFELKSAVKGTFFVVMETFGLPGEYAGNVASGPFGIFTSSTDSYPGSVTKPSDSLYWDGSSWQPATSSNDIGVFIKGTSSEN